MRPGLSSKSVRNQKNIQSEISFYSTRIDCLKKQITALENQLRQYEAWKEEDERELEVLKNEASE